MKVYIASSWRHEHGVTLLTQSLRALGFEVISWIENSYGEGHGPNAVNFEEWMKTPGAQRAFDFGSTGDRLCDLFIYYGPAGKDAAAEAGIAYASRVTGNTPVWMWGLHAKGEDFGLMRKMFNQWFFNTTDLLRAAQELVRSPQPVEP